MFSCQFAGFLSFQAGEGGGGSSYTLWVLNKSPVLM